jgi:hypothetical protein
VGELPGIVVVPELVCKSVDDELILLLGEKPF